LILKMLAVGPLATNCYILGDRESKEAVVIDPGGDFEDIAAQLRESDLKAKYIVLIHELDADMLCSAGQAQPFSLESGKETCRADRTIKEGDRIKFGRHILEVLHTPGHTRGGISLVTDKMIFVGDTLFSGSVGRTDLPGGSFQELMASIKNKLLSMADDCLVYPGHGPASTIGEERKNNPFLDEQ
jgi:hydroxyacylglutathione hydrolase